MSKQTPEFRHVENDKADSVEIPEQDTPANWKQSQSFKTVGHAETRKEGIEKVTGAAQYTTDVQLPGQLSAVVIRSPHAHARVRSVQTAEALALPGVVQVLTHQDVSEHVWYEEEVPLLADVVRFAGDEVAVVAATTLKIARRAAGLIKVEYEILPHVTDMTRALDASAPVVHGDGNQIGEAEVFERGDAPGAIDKAAVTIQLSFDTPTAIHNALESHATVANWTGDSLVIYDSTQGIHSVRSEMAERLDMPVGKVQVICHHMGGGFGAKQKPWKQAMLAALLSRRCGRPVQIFLDRESENLAAGNRNATQQTVTLAAESSGKLTGIKLDAVKNIGAYRMGGEASNVGGLYQHLYQCENVKTTERTVYTHTGPAVAFRAPGYVEACFALESAMDALAHKLGMDPMALRLMNIASEDQVQGLPWSSPDALRRCHERADEAFGWTGRKKSQESTSLRRGFGMASHEWMAGSGNPPGYARIVVESDGSCQLLLGTQDIGTGTRTVLAQVAAEALGVSVDTVQVSVGDTVSGLPAPISSGSFTVPTMAPAVQEAGVHARQQLREAAAKWWQVKVADVFIEDGVMKGPSGHSATLAELMGELSGMVIQAQGTRQANTTNTSIRPFGVQCAEVEVNVDTGEITVLRIVSAPDCGRVLNPLLAESQVIGGVTQGIGFTLTEQRIMDHELGVVLNQSLEDYLVPTTADVPPIEHALVDIPDLNANPTGTKGLGELPLIPCAPAISNAVYDAIGVRFTTLPLSRRVVLDALAKTRQEGASHV